MKLILSFFIWLHGFCYKVISVLVVKVNDGVHPKHKIMRYHRFFVDNVESTDSILDIGCGNGLLACDVADKAKDIFGIDISEKNIQDAKRRCSKDNVEFIHGDALVYDFGKRFNKIVLSNVLEHIEKREEFLCGLTKLSDVLLIRVPLITRDWLAMYKKEQGYDYKLDKTHFIEYTEDGIVSELKKGGWSVKNCYLKWGEWYGVCESN